MTDRYNALTIVLERDIRSDDAETIINAIKMIRGVISVSPNVVDMDSHIAYTRAQTDLSKKLFEVLYPKKS